MPRKENRDNRKEINLSNDDIEYVYDNIKATYGKHKDIDEPRILVDDNRLYGKVVNNEALSLD